jgi:hypothetical protein
LLTAEERKRLDDVRIRVVSASNGSMMARAVLREDAPWLLALVDRLAQENEALRDDGQCKAPNCDICAALDRALKEQS